MLFPNYYVGYHTMKAFLRDYWTVYYEGDSQCNNINNIVLISDPVKIVSRVEFMLQSSYYPTGCAVYLPP
jgi:hypothetical protein